MAKKFLFMSQEGYAQEQAVTDELELGKITLKDASAVSTIVIDGDAKLISGLVAPTADDQAANKKYVDEQDAATLSSANSHADSAASSAQSAAESYTDAQIGSATTAIEAYADTAASSALSSANGYTDAQITSATTSIEAYADAAAASALTDAKTYADGLKVTIEGEITSAISTAEGYADGVAATAESNAKSYAETLAFGLSPKGSVEVAIPVSTGNTGNVSPLSGLKTLDGVPLAADDRVLLMDQSDASQNGLWQVKSGPWVRPQDFAAGSDAHGAFVIVVQGTEKDTGWLCTSAKGSLVDTANLVFETFAGIPAYYADSGVKLDGLHFSVNAGDGLDTDSNKVFVKLNSNALSKSPAGLSFVTDPAGGLKVTSDGAALDLDLHGLKLSGNQLAMDISSDSLEFNGSSLQAKLAANSGLQASGGLKVTGAPQVAGVYWKFGTALSAGTVVKMDPITPGSVAAGSSDNDAGAHVVGVVDSSPASNQFKVVSQGQCAITFMAGAPGAPVYLQSDGSLSTSKPASGSRLILMGYLMSGMNMWVQIRDYGRMA